MPKMNIDLTTVGTAPDGTYTGCAISKYTLQAKTGEKWNNDGTTNIDVNEFDKWLAYGSDLQRVRVHFSIPPQDSLKVAVQVSRDYYMKDSALPFLKDLFKAASAPFDEGGFDFDDLLGKQVTLELVTKESNGYTRQEVLKVTSA